MWGHVSRINRRLCAPLARMRGSLTEPIIVFMRGMRRYLMVDEWKIVVLYATNRKSAWRIKIYR